MPFGWRKKTTNTLFVDCEDGNEDEKILKEEFDSGLGGFGTLDGIHGDPRKPKLTAEYGNHPTEIQRIGVAHANPSENFHASNRDEKGEGNDDDDAEEELDFGDVDDEGSDNNFDDEQSYSTAGFGGPLFNEDDYSVQDSVAMSVDSFDPATQLEQWRSRQAADFLSDFRAKRKSSKDNKKSKRNDAHRDDPESAFATNLDAVDEDDDGSSDGDGSTNHAASQDDTHADIQSNHATLRCSEKDVVEVLDPFAVGDEPFSSEFGTQQNLLFPSGASGTFDTFADDAKPPKDVVDDMEPSAVDDQPFSLELDSHQEVLFPSHVSGTFDSFDEKNSEEVVDDMAHISEHDEPFSSRTTKTVLSPNDATNIVNTFDDDSKTPFVAYNVAETAVETHIISDNLTVKFSPFAMVGKKEAEISEHFANNDDESRSVNLLTEIDRSKDIAGSELLSVHRPKDVFPTATLEAPRHTDLLKELDGQAMTLLESRRKHNIAIVSEQPDIPVSQNENVDENSGIDEEEDRSSVQDIPSLDCVRTDDPSSEVNVQTDMIDTVSIIEEEPAIVQVLTKASINPNEGNEESDSCKSIETIPIEVGIQWSGTVADVSEHGSDHERNHPEFAEFVGDRKQECSENHPSTEVCTSDLDEISFFPTTAVDPVTASREGEVGQEGNDDFPSIFSAHDSGDDAWGCAHVNPSPHAFGKSAEGTGCAVESVSESHVEPTSDRDALALPTMDTRDDSSSKSNNKCPGSDTLPEGEKGDVSDLAFSSQFEGSHQDCLPTQEQGEMTDVIDHQEPTPCGWKQFGGAFTDESGFSAFAKEFAEPAVNRQGSDSSDGNDSTNQEFLVAKKPCSPLKAHLNRLKKAGFDELFGDYDPSVCGMSEAGFSLFTTNTNRSADTEWLVRELINAGDAKSTSDASGYDASKEFTTMIHVIEEGEAAADDWAGCVKEGDADSNWNAFPTPVESTVDVSSPMNETLRVANCCSRESSGSSTAVDRDGERDSIMKSFCTLEEPVCSSLDDERIQSDSNSDYSESDESIGDVDVPFTGKLVIKEAPLLRLENVTQQTRSRIPEDKGIRRKKNKWKWFGKAKAPRSMQQLDQMPSNSDAFADGTPDSSNNKSFPNLNQSTKESGSEGQIFIEHQGTSLATIPIVPTKKARKSKKKDLSSHLGIPAVRKIGRHGDEVSVGTTSKRPSDAQQVVLPRIPMPDNSDNLSVSKERRPWGDKLFPTNQENVGQTSMSPRLGIFGSIVEEAPVPDVLQNQNHALSAFPDDALSYGIPTSRRFDSDGVMQDDAISELQVLSELERNEEPVNDDVNFDDMWDEVSCDVSTALEFQRQKHNRMKKKESDDRTPNDIESCAVPTNRLRLFDADDGEFQDHDDKRCDKLSDEFVSAIRGVFDDNSDCEESCDSNGGGEESSVRSEKPTIRRQSSVTSLFVNGADEPGVQAKVADSSDSDSSTSVGGTDSGSDSEKEAAARTRRKRQKDTVSIAGSRLSRASTRTSRRSSSIKAKPDPKKVLEDEILKARDSKVLSVSSLREEMHSRRGTSANLLRKEYEACKRNSYTDDGRGDINDSAFDTLQLRTKQKDDFFESTTAKLCLDTEPADRRESDNVGSSNGALANSTGSHRARWGRDEQSTELDDLMTVQEAPRQPAFHGVLLKAQDFAATVQANIPTMPHVPGLATIPHLPGFGSMSSLSKSPQKISVSSPIILASPNTTMELPTLSDFGTSRASYTLPFDDGPSTAVAESDEEDDDQKLVSGKGCDHYNDDDEEYSVTPRKQKGIGMKLSAVKIQGISKKVKNLVPKVHGNKRSNGTVLTTADDMHGLLE